MNIEHHRSRIVYQNSVSVQAPTSSRTPEPNPTHSEIVNKNITLVGAIFIEKTRGTNREKVDIVVSLRKHARPRPVQDWNRLINRKQPTTVSRREFVIDRDCWINHNGINWIIPTPLFGETTVKIRLAPSALLSTGFILEIFRRD